MTLKSDGKFEEKVTCALKNDMRNLVNFYQSTRKCQNWDFGPFIQSRKCVSLKFTEEIYVMTMKNDTKIKKELTCHFKIGMSNLTNFDPSTWKSKKFPLYLAPLTKVYNVWAGKVQRTYVCVNLISKMARRIWQISIGWNKWIAHLTKLLTHV